MADDEILSALYPLWRERKRRRAKESYVRRGGWAELCPRLSDRHKPSQPVQCSSSKGFPPPPSQTATLDHWHRPRNMCVWFYQKTTPFSGNVCLFSWHVHSYLIGIAFPFSSFLYASPQRCICTPRILSVRVRLVAYINTAMFKAFTFHTHRAVARHVQYGYFAGRIGQYLSFSFLLFVNKGLRIMQLLYMIR